MPLSTISTKGQITLPASMRRKLNIRPHGRVLVEMGDDAIIIKPAQELFELAGFLGKALPTEQEQKSLEEAVSAHARGAGS